METQKPLLKNEDGEEVDVHMYSVCLYLKGQLKLGLWYPKDSPFDLVAYTDSDYAGASLDRKSTTGGKAKQSVKLMMKKLFRIELELMLLWSTVKAKTINGDVQLHALVDDKKIIIIESTVRRDLQLEDTKGVYCLLNSTIFEQLTLTGSKTTAWNEFSSTMASAIICLATNQKFNFSKIIFEGMIRNLDNVSGKFLMYPRVGKGFSSRVTPLFPTMMVQNQSELGEGSANTTDPHHTPTITQSSTQSQKIQKPRKPKRKDTQIPQSSDPIENVADEAVHKELGDSLVRAATTASSGGPRCQETMGDTIAQTRFENVSKHSNDLLLARGNTLRSDEDRLKLDKLMALCTTLQNRVFDLDKTKTTQHNEIASLKRRVKKLEKKDRSRTHKLKRLYKVGLNPRVESFGDEEDLGEDASKQGRRINVIDADEDITLVNVDVDVLDEVVEVINTAKLIIDAAQVSVASDIVSAASAATTVSSATTTTATINTVDDITLAQDKGKGIMIEELVKPMKKKVQIMLDEEAALKLQDEFDEEERLAREKAKKEKEANIALIEERDDIQVKIDVDHQLAKRLQAQEKKELSDAEKATLFQQLLEKRRKHFAAKREEKRRNRPPTKAQQRQIMCTYLKNMEGYKLKDLRSKGFDSIQEMFNIAFKRVNTFEDFRTELVEGKEKRAGEELMQENAKKQKVEYDKETPELKQCLEIIPDEEEVTIDAIHLAVKSPSIVGWKIHKEGRKSYYQIMRADEKS
ncbi:hypothetical protein Tco_0935327 [Tanacetum coccineum]